MTIKKQTTKTPFELKDVKEPVLYRDMFPYASVPRVVLEERLIQTNIPKDIWITDTTFRDGQQSRPPYTPKQIADIFDFMHRMSGPNGVIRQTEFFLYSEKDREAVRLCKERGYRYPEITGWIRANKNDFKLVKEVGLKETGILTSCSDYHIFLKLNMSRKDALKAYLDIVATAIEQGIVPRWNDLLLVAPMAPAAAAEFWRTCLSRVRPGDMLADMMMSMAVYHLLFALADCGGPDVVDEAIDVYCRNYRLLSPGLGRSFACGAMAKVALTQGRLREAAMLLAYANAAVRSLGQDAWYRDPTPLLEALSRAVAPADLDAWMAAGEKLSEEEALKLPLEEAQR